MRLVRIIAIALVCLGLGIPSAHGIALCLDSDGGFTVEAAVDGACVGARTTCCDAGVGSTAETGMEAPAADQGGSCRDVVLSSDVGLPLPAKTKARRFDPETDSTQLIVEDAPAPGCLFCNSERLTAPVLPVRRPPPRNTVVLQL